MLEKKRKYILFVLILFIIIIMVYIYINESEKNVKLEPTKVQSEIEVTKINLDKNYVSLEYNKSIKLTAFISPQNATNKKVEWVSSNPSLVTVDNNGNVKAVSNKDATATITVKTSDGKHSASAKVNVIKVENEIKATGIKLDKNSITLKYGTNTKLVATITPNNVTNKKVTWSSSNTNLVTVDNNGNISAIGNSSSTVTITAKTSDGKYSASAKVSVIKVENEIKAAGIKLDKNSITLKYGTNTKLVATITPNNVTNKNVTWSSSNANLVTVDNNGNVKAVGNKDGTATITVKTSNGKTAKCTVKVTAIKVTGVKLDKTSVTLEYGKTTRLTATVSPSNAGNKKVTWTSSNTSLVKVDNNGNIKAVGNKNGSATITVKTNDGAYTAKCTVKVTALIVKVSNLKTCSTIDSKLYKTNTNKSIKLKSCINGLILANPGRLIQGLSITDNYVYVTAASTGYWKDNYGITNEDGKVVKIQTKDLYKQYYKNILYSDVFEKQSSIFVTRIEAATGNSQITEIKYSGHGQGFDVVQGKSGDKDLLYLTAVASPYYSSSKHVGALSNGILYTSFKENGGIRIPGETIVFESGGKIKEKLQSSKFKTSKDYYNALKAYSESGSLGILSMATDGTNLAYTIGQEVYIYPLSDVKKANTVNPKKISIAGSGQGIEIDGNNLYYVTGGNKNNKYIKLIKYDITKTDKNGKAINQGSLEIDVNQLYANKSSENPIYFEVEGISIYNNKIYVGIARKAEAGGSIVYNDILLVDGFY